MTTNQIVVNAKVNKTPFDIPNLAIVIAINRGERIAPTRGVKATNQRNISNQANIKTIKTIRLYFLHLD